MKISLFSLLFYIVIAGCHNRQLSSTTPIRQDTSVKTDLTNSSAHASKLMAGAATIMARKEVPVLCYHHIRDLQMPGKADKGYEVTVDEFRQQMKILSDSGFHTISPDQLYDYLAYGAELPPDPVMITFDDTDEEQFTIGKTEMDKYGFKGVYFIMTVSIGRPGYMTKEQIKQLADEGHAIECHTWNHSMVTQYTGDDWQIQLDKPRKKLQDITGRKVDYFAYPYGLWNEAAIPQLRNRDYKMAFQLSTKREPNEPLFTVRRMIVSPDWSSRGMIQVMKRTFH